jgi:AcrR family transcriptional regulator
MNIHSQKWMMQTQGARKKAQAADDKRERLLTAALDLFESRGFDAVAVPEIAARAGVAVGTVYRYFETKEALVNALYRHWKGAYNRMVLAQLPDGIDARETFSLYWRRMMLFARNHPGAVRFMDLHHHAAYLDAESRAMSRSYAQVAADFVRAGRDAGVMRNLDPVMVVALMWGAAAGLTKFSASGALTVDVAMTAQMEDALWRAIANDSHHRRDGHGTQTQG